jgi:hypothetical protein
MIRVRATLSSQCSDARMVRVELGYTQFVVLFRQNCPQTKWTILLLAAEKPTCLVGVYDSKAEALVDCIGPDSHFQRVPRVEFLAFFHHSARGDRKSRGGERARATDERDAHETRGN